MEPIDLQIKKKNNHLLPLVIILVLVLAFSALFVKIIFVVDANTSSPISNANVSIDHPNWATSCGETTTEMTNGLGFIFSIGGICGVSVGKEGYHVNGFSRSGHLVSVIKLNKISNPVQPVTFMRNFKTGEGMDIVSYFHDLKTAIPEDMYLDKNKDFVFEQNNTIVFNGEGGVQEIDKNALEVRSGDQKFFGLQNLLKAPRNDYSKSLKLSNGRAYVARLADGEHYIKFTSTIKDNSSGVCLRVYAQPEATDNLEYINILNDGTFGNSISFCDEFILNPGNSDYDKKIKYIQMKKDFSSPQKVDTDSLGMIITDTGYYISTPWRTENMQGKYVTVIAPSYEKVKSFYRKEHNMEWFDAQISLEVYKDSNRTPLK